MTTAWKPTRLGDVLKIKHGFAFSGMAENRDTSLPVVVGIGNFDYTGGFRFGSTTLKRYAGEYPPDFNLAPGDVLLAMTCQTAGGEILGIPGVVPDDGQTYLHNQRLGKVEVRDPERIDLPFIFQLARWQSFNHHLFATASGSKILHTSPGRIEEFIVKLPPLMEQHAIAATLGALDDKIESNRQMVTSAQDLGDALFISASAETRSIEEVATITMGSSPKGETLNESGNGIPFYQGTRDFGFRFPSLRIWTESPVRFASQNDTLMSVRAPVGELNRAGADCCIGRGVAALHSDKQPSTLFYALRASGSTWDKFQGEGTVFASVNRKDVHGSEIRWVPDAVSAGLESELSALDKRIESLESESRRLSALRDSLLPELLSGRIRVPAEGRAA